MPKKRPWTPQEEQYLQEHCEDMSINLLRNFENAMHLNDRIFSNSTHV